MMQKRKSTCFLSLHLQRAHSLNIQIYPAIKFNSVKLKLKTECHIIQPRATLLRFLFCFCCCFCFFITLSSVWRSMSPHAVLTFTAPLTSSDSTFATRHSAFTTIPELINIIDGVEKSPFKKCLQILTFFLWLSSVLT